MFSQGLRVKGVGVLPRLEAERVCVGDGGGGWG